MTYVVYRILNIKNNRIYIGSTSQYEIRKLEHLGFLRTGKHHNRFLQTDFNDFKEESFVFEIIKDGFETRESMLISEYELILKFSGKCYNIHTDCPIKRHSKTNKIKGRKILYAKKVKDTKKKTKVKGNHKIKTHFPELDAIALRKQERESRQKK